MSLPKVQKKIKKQYFLSNADQAIEALSNQESKKENEADMSKSEKTTYQFKLKNNSSKTLSKNALKLKMAASGQVNNPKIMNQSREVKSDDSDSRPEQDLLFQDPSISKTIQLAPQKKEQKLKNT